MIRGRKRKAGLRERSGRAARETVEQRLAVVLAQPHRRWAKNPRDERLGYPLGRLEYCGYITKDQLDAGNWWAEKVRAFASMNGIPVENPRAALGNMIGTFDGGYRWESEELSDDEADKKRRRLTDTYNGCYEALVDCGNTLGVGNKVAIICRRICIQEHNEVILWPREIGNLRVGLNALDNQRKSDHTAAYGKHTVPY